MPFDYSRAGLVAAAGTDPWTVSEPVLAGRPEQLVDAGAAFRRGSVQAVESARQGRVADLALAGAYTNDAAAVFDAAASTGEGRVLLSEDGELMEEAARIVLRIGDGLVEAQEAVRTAINGLELDVSAAIERRNTAVAAAGPLTQADLQALDARYHAQATDAVVRRAATIQRAIDDYDALIVNRTGHLADLGYVPPSGVPEPPQDGGVGGFLGDVWDGAGSALAGTGELLGMLNPVRAFTDGDAYWDDRVQFAGELWQLPGGSGHGPARHRRPTHHRRKPRQGRVRPGSRRNPRGRGPGWGRATSGQGRRRRARERHPPPHPGRRPGRRRTSRRECPTRTPGRAASIDRLR